MDVHHGIIKSLDLKNSGLSSNMQDKLRRLLVAQKLQDVHGWATHLEKHLGSLDAQTITVAKRLDELLPVPRFARP
jgi:lipoate-protein ligase A